MKMEKRLNAKQEEIVLENIGLVRYIVRKTTFSQSDYEDLVSIGTIGLIKAVQTFKEDKAAKFATYAAICIKNEIFMYLRKKRKYNVETSIYEPMSTNDDESEKIDCICDEKNLPIEEKIVGEENVKEVIDICLNCLTSEEKVILMLTIAGVTQVKIAKWCKKSQKQISKSLKKILNKIKYYLSDIAKIVERRNYIVEVIDERIKITIISVGINNALKRFLLGIEKESKEMLEVNYWGNSIVLYMPMEEKYFLFLAKIIHKIERK